ncbi:MAG: prolipoprotein diacylglyceryl transferase [Lachnospiraceae bacterium]|nr:prolipoprotein diacylglyceryl transferase [Lachnospiraceae bacterium]
MHNELLTIGPITIYGYGLMIAIGVIAALLVGEYRANKRGLNGDLIYGMTFSAVIFGFVAARILFIITEWRDFLQNPKDLIAGNGFVVYGGIIGGILTVYIYCRLKKVNFIDYFDLMVPSVALAQGFGRIGCFLAGCCYGRETDSIFGIVFHNSAYAPNNVRLIPTQLMMSAGDFVIAAILLWYSKKERTKGKTGTLYLILYSIGRFIIEFFRNDDRGAVGVLSTSQFIGIFMFVIALYLFFFYFPKRKQEA